MRWWRTWSGSTRHALVTVAATVSAAGAVSTRYLVVPVARDAAGGLVVSELPSFAAPPAVGRLEPATREPLTGTDAAQVEDVLVRFFRAFLAGRSEELEYLVPAGARIGALAEPLELVGVDSLYELDPGEGGARSLAATVQARDRSRGRCTRSVTGCGWCAGTAGTWRR